MKQPEINNPEVLVMLQGLIMPHIKIITLLSDYVRMTYETEASPVVSLTEGRVYASLGSGLCICIIFNR